MMGCVPALKAAMDLRCWPPQAPVLRAGPLPDGILTLLRIAAGDAEAMSEATTSTGQSYDAVREATAFFIEQVLLHPDADSYRVLGVASEATYAELRRNMALLLTWLHPDRDRRGERSIYAARVTRAWNDLKTQERRVAYDQLQRSVLAEKSRARTRADAQSKKRRSHHRHSHRGPYGNRHVGVRRSRYGYPGFLRRVLLALFGRAAHW
jgi:hypothetical protein